MKYFIKTEETQIANIMTSIFIWIMDINANLLYVSEYSKREFDLLKNKSIIFNVRKETK